MNAGTPGCCTSCSGEGTGGTASVDSHGGACWDCQGTGHPHNWDTLVLVPGFGCMTQEEADAIAAELGAFPVRYMLGMGSDTLGPVR